MLEIIDVGAEAATAWPGQHRHHKGLLLELTWPQHGQGHVNTVRDYNLSGYDYRMEKATLI